MTEKRCAKLTAAFHILYPLIKSWQTDILVIFGWLLGPESQDTQADLCQGEIAQLKNVNEILEKLDAHYGFYMLKTWFNLPKPLNFLRTSPCFNHQCLLEQYDEAVRKGLSKVCNVNCEDVLSTQLALPGEMVVWGFFRSTTSASRFLSFRCCISIQNL